MDLSSVPVHPATTVLANNIKDSIKNILLTPIGTTPGFPAFGSNISKYMFELFSPSLAQDLSLEVKRAISEFEPRVDVLACDVSDNQEYGSIRLDIHYVIRSQSDTGTGTGINNTTETLVLTLA